VVGCGLKKALLLAKDMGAVQTATTELIRMTLWVGWQEQSVMYQQWLVLSSTALNKAHQFAACGRRTPFSLRLRLHYKGAVVRWR
jgi:hypothetical protein